MNDRRAWIALGFLAASLFGLPAGSGAAEQPPRRIVSLAPSVTETLFALGAGDRLVGVTTYCNYPDAARRLPKIGDFLNPSLEMIVAARPDLVIGVAGTTDPGKANQMKRLGLKVSLVSVASLKNILRSIRHVAGLAAKPALGDQLAQRIEAEIRRVRIKVGPAPNRSVLLLVGLRPLVAVGGKNFIDELITTAGGDNIARRVAQPWLNLPEEFVVAEAPQVIIQAGMGSERQQSTHAWRDLRSIPAVRDGRVYTYPSDKLLRPGPRVGEAALELARMIHPECFAAASGKSDSGESRC